MSRSISSGHLATLQAVSFPSEDEEVHSGTGAPSEVPDRMEALLQEDTLACPGDEHHTDHEVAWEVSFLVVVEEFLAVVAAYLQLVQLVDYPGKPVRVEEDCAGI